MGSTPTDLSASRGSAVLGLNSYKTQVEVWLEIMEGREGGFCEANGYVKPVPEEGAPLRWGSHFEKAVIMLAEAVDGVDIVHREKFFRGPLKKHKFATCHIDGRKSNTRTLHEGKTSNLRTWSESYGKPGTDRIPTYIQVQVQQQMYCARADKNIVSVLVFPEAQAEIDKIIELEHVNPFHWAKILRDMGLFHQYPIERNDEAIKAMLEAYEHFWKHCVIGKNEPVAGCYGDLRKLFPSPIGTIVANDRIERLSAEYKDIGGEIKDLNNRKDKIKKIIIHYAREKGIRDGVNIDDDSAQKLLILDQKGLKIHSYNGKMFR